MLQQGRSCLLTEAEADLIFMVSVCFYPLERVSGLSVADDGFTRHFFRLPGQALVVGDVLSRKPPHAINQFAHSFPNHFHYFDRDFFIFDHQQ